MKNNFKEQFITALSECYDTRELKSMWRILQEDIFQLEGYDRLDSIISELKEHVPLQYITQVEYFYGYKFKVTPDVLIPRPETEELVEWVLSSQPRKANTILDIGTGSGCAACALKKERPKWNVMGMDISEGAVQVAKENATMLDVDVHFFIGDMCNEEDYPKDVDIILCNPPYVLRSDLSIMTMSVDRYEPHLALYAPDKDPLYFYRSVLNTVQALYSKGTEVYFEIHHHFAKELIQLCKAFNMNSVEVREDLEGLPRMLHCIQS